MVRASATVGETPADGEELFAVNRLADRRRAPAAEVSARRQNDTGTEARSGLSLAVRKFMAQTNPPFMTGVPELLVLRMLASREMYGYEIVLSLIHI